MSKEEKWKRISELEKQAKDKYCDEIAWTHIINMLSDDEKAEYYRLIDEVK